MAAVSASGFFSGWVYGITRTFVICQLYPGENYGKILPHCVGKFGWRITTSCREQNLSVMLSRGKPQLL